MPTAAGVARHSHPKTRATAKHIAALLLRDLDGNLSALSAAADCYHSLPGRRRRERESIE